MLSMEIVTHTKRWKTYFKNMSTCLECRTVQCWKLIIQPWASTVKANLKKKKVITVSPRSEYVCCDTKNKSVSSSKQPSCCFLLWTKQKKVNARKCMWEGRDKGVIVEKLLVQDPVAVGRSITPQPTLTCASQALLPERAVFVWM